MNWPDDFVNKIICGDCLEVMREMPDKCVDFIITDPPYKNEDINGNYYNWLEIFFDESERVTKDYLVMFNNASRLYDILCKIGPSYRILIWTKGVVKYSWRWEPVFIYSFNPDYSLNKTIWSDHLPYQPLHRGQSLHPYEKPLKLMIQLLKYIPENKIILDPFLGSGTTAVACKEMKQQFIGIEINPEYCKMAEERLAQGVL